mgnify:CR=1 FL=1
MEISVFLAKLIGTYMVIVAVGFLVNRNIYQRLIDDFSKSPALTYMGAVLAIITGLLIVMVHNVWVISWPVIITIFGWLGLIKGILLVVFPDSVIRLAYIYQRRPGLLTANLIIFLLLGIVLVFKGYFI